jgi:YfiH family protein
VILSSPLLERLGWIEHGFGTRHAPLSQDGMASLKQIHSSVCLIADRTSGCVGEGDGLITDRPDVTVSVRTADCFPILLADLSNRVIAAVHAGWRGSAGHVVIEALRRIGATPQNVHAAIGPGIGVCCYEVGSEVARQFGLDRAGKIDLAEANRRQLIEAGVPESQIEILDACTCCDPERFHSYRRDKQEAGRMISYIRILTPVS